jgi:dolichyl-diphosphooligosaccharide--protein glycosyltransferase
VALYLFCYYRFGNLAALVSCIFVGSAPIFVARSCAGWFDMDVLSLLLPLLITWTYLKAHGVLSFGRKILWICFSGFWTGIFCFTWPHWWFIFLIINIYEFYFLTNLVFMYLQYKEKNLTLFKEHFLSLCLFIFFSFFWIVVFAGPLPARELYYQVTAALRLNKAISSAFFWPNVYTTVAELKKANIIQIANSTGGVLSFVFSLFSMLLLFLRSSRNRRYSSFEYNSIIILVFWTLSMFFACYKGIRFSMFLALPLGICLGWVIKDAYAYFENRKMKWVVIFVLTITLLLSSNFIHNANSVAKNIYPLMNDDWHQALITIRDSTPKESVINSWWDFGDWFKVVSRRRVIFDGQSQNIPQAYWMAKVLASENEEEAIGILRMLNNGGNQAFNIINGHLKDSFKSILLLEKIIPLDPSTAKNNLLKFLPPSLAEEVIKLIFARPPEAYFVVDDSMQVKMSAISYLGNWDFLKAYMAGSTDKKEKERMINLFVELGGDPGQVQKFYQEVQLVSGDDLPSLVSHVLKFRSGLIKGKEKDGTVLFDAGLIYSPKEERFYVYSSQEGKYKIPKSLFVFQNDKIKEIVYPDNDLDFSVLMLKTKDGYASILLDRELAKSLFVRLYFLEGVGLKHFQPFTEEKKQDASIRVFKIIWD